MSLVSEAFKGSKLKYTIEQIEIMEDYELLFNSNGILYCNGVTIYDFHKSHILVYLYDSGHREYVIVKEKRYKFNSGKFLYRYL